MSDKDVVTSEIVRAFEVGQYSWSLDAHKKSTAVTYYMSCIRVVENMPFSDIDVQTAVLDALNAKLNDAVIRMTDETMFRIKGIILDNPDLLTYQVIPAAPR